MKILQSRILSHNMIASITASVKQNSCGNFFRSAVQQVCRWTFFCCLLLASGCGKNLVKMSGQVTYPDGKPLQVGYVVFCNMETNFLAKGLVDCNGNYHIGTYKERDGLPPGDYTVRVDDTVVPVTWDLSKPPGERGPISLDMVNMIEEGFETKCSVEKGTSVFDFEVPYPSKKQKKTRPKGL